MAENQEPKSAQQQIEEAPEQEVRHFGGSVLKRNKETGEVTRSSYVGPGEELAGEAEEKRLEAEAKKEEEAAKKEAPPKATTMPAEQQKPPPTTGGASTQSQ